MNKAIEAIVANDAALVAMKASDSTVTLRNI